MSISKTGERKFAARLRERGEAARVREDIALTIRDSTCYNKVTLTEPVDYENIVVRNKTLIDNDPMREMLIFPPDDVSQSTLPRRYRTVRCSVPASALREAESLLVKECIKTYTSKWNVIHYKYNAYSGTYQQLPRVTTKAEELPRHIFEVDAEDEGKEEINMSTHHRKLHITKQGWLYRGLDSAKDSSSNLIGFSKSFKRRYVYLKQQQDTTYCLEFHKDDKKIDEKGQIFLEMAVDVVKTSKRGKPGFDIKMQDKTFYSLATDAEPEADAWVETLKKVLTTNEMGGTSPLPKSRPKDIDRSGKNDSYRDFEQSMHPELQKHALESDKLLTKQRMENRQNIFAIFPELQRAQTLEDEDPQADVYKEKFGTRFVIRFEDFRSRLQWDRSGTGDEKQFSNPEPFFITLALYDAKEGKKLSEDFTVQANQRELQAMVSDQVPPEILGGAPQSPTDSSAVNDTSGINDGWYQMKKRGIFSVSSPHSEILLVVRIEKILQGGVSTATDPYCRTPDTKTAEKVNRNMKLYCQRLGIYRMPLAWGARKVFMQFSKDLDTVHDFVIYRQESSKMSSEDFFKNLQEFGKPDKQSKLQGILLDFKVSIHKYDPELKNMMTSSLVPIRPFPDVPEQSASVEVQEFVPEDGKLAHPHSTYTNHIYVYPRQLKYDNQKAFTKARNLVCFIQIRDRDDADAKPLKRIYARPGPAIFTTYANTAVIHHDTTPEFTEEVKIMLPTQLKKSHHLLFSFYHISCELPKTASTKASSKRGSAVPHTCVGYSWLPILNTNGRVNTGEIQLPVASNLPAGYTAYQNLGLGKGYLGPDVKFVDQARALFRVDVNLCSTVYTKDQHLHNFFMHCDKMSESPRPSSDVDTKNRLKHAGNGSATTPSPTDSIDTKDMLKYVKSLLAVDASTVIEFLPTLFNQLFRLLPQTQSPDVAMNVVGVLIHMVSLVHDNDKEDILHTYVKYVFVTETFLKRTIHGELSQQLKTTLMPSKADQLVVSKFMKYSWFFFEVLLKSMAQHLLATGRIKMPRNERFSSDYQFHIQTLVKTLSEHIVKKSGNNKMTKEVKNANSSLAKFVKGCFTLMDRGFVFKLINMYMENFPPGSSKTLQEYKFEFLKIVCNHEHYIPLNLPFLRKNANSYKDDEAQDLKHDYTLSDEFRRDHFLVGLLLQEVKQALNEIKDIRRSAVAVLRNLLAKHSFDDRYSGKAQQAKLNTLYLPFISIILENKNRLQLPDKTGQRSASFRSVANGEAPAPARQMSVTFANGTSPGDNTGSTGNTTPRPIRDTRVLEMISSPVASALHPDAKTGEQGSKESLASTSTVSSQSAAVSDIDKVDGRTGHSRASSGVVRYDKLDEKEIRDLLVCFLYIIKNLSEEVLLGWFNNSSEGDVLDFLAVLEIIMQHFKYQGKKRIQSLCIIGGGKRAMTLPPKKSGNAPVMRTASTASESPLPTVEPKVAPSQSEADAMFFTMQTANLSSEVALTVLDVVSLYTNSFKDQLQHRDGDNDMMHKTFDLYLHFLQTSQSETVQKHAFAALRAFIKKFPGVLFRGEASMCGRLCYEILRCCTSRLSSTRQEACALMYWLMRRNFEHNKQRNFTRVHLQAIISVSQLLNDVIGLSNDRFSDSLSIINNYAASDKHIRGSSFAIEVKDLTKRIRTVLMATAQMKEHQNDPEMLVDLQYSLAKSYTSTPELRKTWLANMAKNHVKESNYSEAAHCYIHIAALVAEYLQRRGSFPQGCNAFKKLSPNVESEEIGMRDDSGMQDVQYTEMHLIELLEQCGEYLEQAERYEMLGDLYRLIIPVYEANRDFERLARCYATLQRAYSKVVEVMRTGKRMLGNYFRVAFFGQSHFDEEDGKVYIYKEPKVTGLGEICGRLKTIYTEKFGPGIVRLIQDSKQVKQEDLDPRHAYIQITHVTPFYDEEELLQRKTEFERNSNIRRFMYETPFTKDGRARGEIHEQHKRKTILTTSHSFPYVKKRIQVVYQNEIVLTPIEVAIDEMQNRVADLRDLVDQVNPDPKRLQLKLQGSVSVMVHAGPLAYAEAFLTEENAFKYSKPKIEQLKQVYKEFVDVCQQALEANSRLISSDQLEYQMHLKDQFRSLGKRLGQIFRERLIEDDDNISTTSSHRDSMTVFREISATASTNI